MPQSSITVITKHSPYCICFVAVIYNSTPTHTYTNPAVVVLDFGSDKTSTAGDFTIVFPVADASNALIRIA